MENKFRSWVFIILIVILMAVTYLPLIHRLGYFNDDWYLMYAARIEGPDIFHEIFSIDRPLRAYVLGPAFAIFGANPVYYNLSAWGFRLVSVLCFLWTLRMVWPLYPMHTFLMALLYGLYPGFLSQHNGIDYQSQMLSLALVMLSIALTVRAFLEKRRLTALLWLGISILLGWGYLGLVEYEVGFEFMRLALVYLLVARGRTAWKERLKQTVMMFAPYLAIPLGYGLWRIFLFENERKATDLGAQFAQAALYPLQTVYHWLAQILQDAFDVIFSAWVIPLTQLNAHLHLWSAVIAVLFGAAIAYFAFYRDAPDREQEDVRRKFLGESLLFGLLSAIAGVIPVVLVNRQVEFPAFSRYALASSAGVAIFVIALLACLNQRLLRAIALASLLFISMATHQANMVKYVQETDAVRTFWWQVAWRVPQFKQNATLMVRYPVGAIEEDYFIWGPANMIYYPENLVEREANYIRPGIFAFVLNDKTIQPVIVQERQDYEKRRAVRTFANPRNLVVLSRPTPASCVQVMDGTQPIFSSGEIPAVMVVAPYSETEQILTADRRVTPPLIPFGPEPSHDWCYYFEKASLARQRGDWEEVVALGREAREKGWKAQDLIEWMPFLQAYALQGDVTALTEIAGFMAKDRFVSRQACEVLTNTPGISPKVQEQAVSLLCPKP